MQRTSEERLTKSGRETEEGLYSGSGRRNDIEGADMNRRQSFIIEYRDSLQVCQYGGTG